MTEAREMSTDYPLHVHELVEAEANAARLLSALKVLRDEICGVDRWWGALSQAADVADDAIDKAEKRL